MKAWWSRRNGKQRFGIIAGVLLVLLILTPSDDAGDGSSDKAKPASDKKAASTAKAAARPVDPITALESDVRKNAKDEYGKRSVKLVECTSTKNEPNSCRVLVRVGAFSDEDGLTRQMGGGVHELFRDTKVQHVYLYALSETVDSLGNENKDDQVGWIAISREQWAKVDWDNLKYMDPTEGLREVAEAVAITVKF